MRTRCTLTLSIVLAVTCSSVSVKAQARSARAAQESQAKNATAQESKQLHYTGKVTNERGTPIAGAKVSLYTVSRSTTIDTYDVKLVQEVTTEAKGTFSLNVAESEEYQQGVIIAKQEGLAVGWAYWGMREDRKHDIRLEEPKQLSGVVVDEDDNPLAGAEVFIAAGWISEPDEQHRLLGPVSRRLFTSKTDATGTFTFAGLPPEATFELGAKKPSYATLTSLDRSRTGWDELQFAPGQPDIKLVMPLEAKIRGTVVEQSSGRPIGAVTIRVTSSRLTSYFQPEPVVSQDDGTFQIDSLLPGTHTVSVPTPRQGPAPWVAQPIEVTLQAGETKSNVKLQLTKGGVIEVLVKGATSGKPIQKANINIRNYERNQWFHGRTDETGIARVRLLPGSYELTGAYKRGYSHAGQQEPFSVEGGQTKRLERTLSGMPQVCGVVLGQDDKPLAGVKVQVLPSGHAGDTSDSRGRFEAQYDPSHWSSRTVFYVVARDKQRNLAAAMPVDENGREVEVKLRPGVTLTGTVTDEQGKPIEDARMQIMLHVSNWGSTIEYRGVRTDAQGRFEVNAVPPEQRYDLTAMADGYGQMRITAEDSKVVGERVDVGQFRLAVADMSVSGVVVDADGKPVPGAQIYCYGNSETGQPDCRTQTDGEGKWTLDGVCAGRIQIRAHSRGATYRYGSVETEAGATEVRIVVVERGSGQTRYVPKQHPSLVGKALPELKALDIDLEQETLEDKIVLVCFWDMQQRPSRHFMRQLTEEAAELRKRGVVVAAIQASKIDARTLKAWVKKHDIGFHTGMIKDDADKTKFSWGVRSLPWLILTDRKHVVVAEGFGLHELDDRVSDIGALP